MHNIRCLFGHREQMSVGYAWIMLVVENDPFDRPLLPFGARQSGLR